MNKVIYLTCEWLREHAWLLAALIVTIVFFAIVQGLEWLINNTDWIL